MGAATAYSIYLFVHTSPSSYLAAALRGGYIHSTFSGEGRQMLQPG